MPELTESSNKENFIPEEDSFIDFGWATLNSKRNKALPNLVVVTMN